MNISGSGRGRMHEDLRSAAEALERNDVRITWDLEQGNRDGGIDGRLVFDLEGTRWETSFLYKSQLRPSTVGLLWMRGPDTLIVSHHITPAVAEYLREQGLNYMDSAGNARIRAPQLVLEIQGRRPDDPRESPTPTSIFTPRGLPVILALLNRPDLIAAPMREIQARTDVSLGTVQKVVDSLRRDGYTEQTWSRPADRARWRRLLEGWVAAYLAGPRSALVVNRFSTDRTTLHDVMGLVASLPVAASGEAAAEMLGYSIRPTTIDLYVHDRTQPPESLLRRARLRADPQGWITVRHAPWSKRAELDAPRTTPVPVALAPVLYADLVGVGDPRLDEIGRELVTHDPYLRNYFD